MNKLLVAAGAALMALGANAADAATFVLHASTHDSFNGLPITYDGVLTTGDASATADGDSYELLDATGTASYDGFVADILGGMGTFTLNGGDVVAMDAGFLLDRFGFGAIQRGPVFNFIAVSEVAGPVQQLTITPQVGAAVPEPASWAMMIAGFGLVGTALRRRRARVAFA